MTLLESNRDGSLLADTIHCLIFFMSLLKAGLNHKALPAGKCGSATTTDFFKQALPRGAPGRNLTRRYDHDFDAAWLGVKNAAVQLC